MNLIDSIEAIVRATELRQQMVHDIPQHGSAATVPEPSQLQPAVSDETQPRDDGWDPLA